jgi:hypothetical protein
MNKNDMNMKRQQHFIKVVSRRMAKAGFECKMVDNHFIVIMDGKPFEVEMWDTPGWGRRRVHFNLSFAFDEMDKVLLEGLVWLTSECNNHSDYTVTRYMRDHFTCCVETTVRSSKEFVREFAFATKQIGFTYQNLAANYGKIKEKFREQPVRPIGFLANRYMAEEEKNEECKLVAQSYTTFAGEINNTNI